MKSSLTDLCSKHEGQVAIFSRRTSDQDFIRYCEKCLAEEEKASKPADSSFTQAESWNPQKTTTVES
jgi:hypothetical protein